MEADGVFVRADGIHTLYFHPPDMQLRAGKSALFFAVIHFFGSRNILAAVLVCLGAYSLGFSSSIMYGNTIAMQRTAAARMRADPLSSADAANPTPDK